MADFRFEITKELGVLSENLNSSKRVNYIRYNGREPKLDIRDWYDEGEKMGKGITLSAEEAVSLRDILIKLDI